MPPSPDTAADLLVCCAHPDDAELFCGGTIARAVETGRRVLIADLTRGEKSSRGAPPERAAEAAEGARILGARRCNLDCGDTVLDNNEANRLRLIAVIREARPTVVITHDPHDRHPDHRKAHDLVRDACFYANVAAIDTGQPRHRPAGLFLCFGNPAGPWREPGFVVDITPVFKKKLDSIRAYRTQFFGAGYEGAETFISTERYWRSIEGRARLMGSLIDVEFGEAFSLPAPLAVSDITALAALR